MERLIKDLLEIKRIEAGYFSLERERISVQSLISEAVETLEPLVTGKEIRFLHQPVEDSPHVLADRERIMQVFSNLVGNAVKFTPAGGSITLGTQRRDNDVVFFVRDSGAGIPPEDLHHVFDRFWQARRRGRHGIGLGLAIVKGIVEAHNGAVWVESELGTGSTFYFTIRLID
jgi:signal transduction histidine kinase